MVSGWENIIWAPGNLTKGEGQGWRQGRGIAALGDVGAPCLIGLVVNRGEVMIGWNRSRGANWPPEKRSETFLLGSDVLPSVTAEGLGACGSHSLGQLEAAVRPAGRMNGGVVFCVCVSRK